MANTNYRQHDITLSEKAEMVLDQLYTELGWEYRRTNRFDDLRGVDAVVNFPGVGEIRVDEKVATKYWDRDLNTFGCELTNTRTKTGLGWFAAEENGWYKTSHLMFVWVRANDAELDNITRLEICLVDKKALQALFQQKASSMDTRTFVEETLKDQDVAYLGGGVKVKQNRWGVEQSANVIFSKWLLKEMALFTRTFEFAN